MGSPRDLLIAATAALHGLTLATRDERDFEDCGVMVVNLFDGSGDAGTFRPLAELTSGNRASVHFMVGRDGVPIAPGIVGFPMQSPGDPLAGLPQEPTGASEAREPRELRTLVPFEVAAVIGLAIVPLPGALPVALPLLVVATASRWARRRDWNQLMHAGGWTALVGAVAGLVALGLAVVAGTPFVEKMSGRAVEWSAFPAVRGSASQLALVALIVIAVAIASELALRGWIVERVLELSPGPPVLPVLVGAFAEALVTPGDAAARIGAGLFGAGLGAIYVASGRSVIAPICARAAFSLGATVLEALRIIG